MKSRMDTAVAARAEQLAKLPSDYERAAMDCRAMLAYWTGMMKTEAARDGLWADLRRETESALVIGENVVRFPFSARAPEYLALTDP